LEFNLGQGINKYKDEYYNDGDIVHVSGSGQGEERSYDIITLDDGTLQLRFSADDSDDDDE
jgi:hypothetical protein